MKRTAYFLSLALALLAAAMPLAAQTSNVPSVPQWTVVPVKFDEQLSVRDNQVGDPFSVTVADDNGFFPPHTRMNGHVVAIHWGNRHRPPSMDLQLDNAELPGGLREPLDAVPIPLNAKYVHRGRDGRYYADQAQINGRAYEAAGTIGGLVVGGLFNRPFLGAFLGTIAGIVAASSARDNPDNYLVAKQGSKAGALFEENAPLAAPPAQAGPPVRDNVIRIGGRVVQFPVDQLPYWSNQDRERVLMTPLQFMADQLSLSVSPQADGALLVADGGNRIHLIPGSRDYRLNGHSGRLRQMVERTQDGVVYVPIEVFAMLGRRDIFVNDVRVVTGRGREPTGW